MPERGGTLANAQADLTTRVVDALDLILNRAITTGQEALKGLAAIGVGNLGHAAGVVGMNIAQYLGQAEKVSRLYNLFRGFAIQAYEAVLALVGNQLAQTMAGKVVEWFDQVQKGRKLEELLEWLYQTGPTGRDLGTFIKDSKATPDRFLKAFQEVAGLEGRVRWTLTWRASSSPACDTSVGSLLHAAPGPIAPGGVVHRARVLRDPGRGRCRRRPAAGTV